tara:strand:- start:56 stop:244 length:189 start_codon:yes stop_codon:yes gene_type:complete
MTEKEKLFIALTQIDNVVTLLDNNEWKNYLYNHLSPIKYELERQLTNLNVYEATNKNGDRNS